MTHIVMAASLTAMPVGMFRVGIPARRIRRKILF